MGTAAREGGLVPPPLADLVYESLEAVALREEVDDEGGEGARAAAAAAPGILGRRPLQIGRVARVAQVVLRRGGKWWGSCVGLRAAAHPSPPLTISSTSRMSHTSVFDFGLTDSSGDRRDVRRA